MPNMLMVKMHHLTNILKFKSSDAPYDFTILVRPVFQINWFSRNSSGASILHPDFLFYCNVRSMRAHPDVHNLKDYSVL